MHFIFSFLIFYFFFYFKQIKKKTTSLLLLVLSVVCSYCFITFKLVCKFFFFCFLYSFTKYFMQQQTKFRLSIFYHTFGSRFRSFIIKKYLSNIKILNLFIYYSLKKKLQGSLCFTLYSSLHTITKRKLKKKTKSISFESYVSVRSHHVYNCFAIYLNKKYFHFNSSCLF